MPTACSRRTWAVCVDDLRIHLAAANTAMKAKSWPIQRGRRITFVWTRSKIVAPKRWPPAHPQLYLAASCSNQGSGRSGRRYGQTGTLPFPLNCMGKSFGESREVRTTEITQRYMDLERFGTAFAPDFLPFAEWFSRLHSLRILWLFARGECGSSLTGNAVLTNLYRPAGR